MSGLEYPRTWFRVSRYGQRAEAREFVRETEHMLFYVSHRGEHREKKVSQYERWYPTIEEAEAVVTVIKGREAERADRALKHAAASELYEAALAALDFLGSVDGAAEVRGILLAAIAKAEGRS